MMHVRAFSFLGLCARNSLTFAALRSGDGLGPRCQYYRSPSLATALEPPNFNHALVRGAIGAIQYVAGYVTKFQSTHPRGVRHIASDDTVQIERVSIHAPAWGATMVRRGRLASPTRFNPRTRVGCDEWSQTSQCRNHWFQSTHPRGVRLPVMRRRFQPHHVSIHAPAWGTTLRQTSGQRLDSCFNPRTRVGCDTSPATIRCRSSAFQSTHPRGVRRWYGVGDWLRLRVSIHAPAWGATSGARPASAAIIGFNPRTRVGCDGTGHPAFFAVDVFQSTHPRGVRPPVILRLLQLLPVSIHAPAWGAT